MRMLKFFQTTWKRIWTTSPVALWACFKISDHAEHQASNGVGRIRETKVAGLSCTLIEQLLPDGQLGAGVLYTARSILSLQIIGSEAEARRFAVPRKLEPCAVFEPSKLCYELCVYCGHDVSGHATRLAAESIRLIVDAIGDGLPDAILYESEMP